MNYKIKKLMLDYIFQYLNKVYFDIWETNYRSQKSVEKLGGERLSLEKNNKYLYLIEKIVWGNFISTEPKNS
jgi:RimJ/RimL family protein N-acetyltransferase